MKNYFLEEKEAKNFIMYYVKKGDLLEIHYGSGEIKPRMYTPEEEKKLLDKMKEQVLNVNEFYEIHKKRENKLDRNLYIGMVSVVSTMAIGAAILELKGDYSMLITFPACVIAILFLPFRRIVDKIHAEQELLEDIEKNKWFLENEKKMNESPLIKKEGLVFNLNLIDTMGLEELKEVLAHVEIYEQIIKENEEFCSMISRVQSKVYKKV